MTDTPGVETLKVVVTGQEESQVLRIQLTFNSQWRDLLPYKFDVTGTLSDKLVLTPSLDRERRHGRSIVDRYPGNVSRVSLHARMAGREINVGEVFHVSSVKRLDSGVVEIVTTESKPEIKAEAVVPGLSDLRAAVETLNAALESTPGAVLRVEDNRARVSLEIY